MRESIQDILYIYSSCAKGNVFFPLSLSLPLYLVGFNDYHQGTYIDSGFFWAGDSSILFYCTTLCRRSKIL